MVVSLLNRVANILAYLPVWFARVERNWRRNWPGLFFCVWCSRKVKASDLSTFVKLVLCRVVYVGVTIVLRYLRTVFLYGN